MRVFDMRKPVLKFLSVLFVTVLVAGSLPGTASAADTTPPTVVSVSPSGANAPTPGAITITFSEPMDTSMTYLQNAAVITLAHNFSTGYLLGQTGHWVNDTTFEIPYPQLPYSFEVEVVIQFFRDVAGNVMETDASHSFTTKADDTSSSDTTGTVIPSPDTTGTVKPSQPISKETTALVLPVPKGDELPPTGDSALPILEVMLTLVVGASAMLVMLRRRRA